MHHNIITGLQHPLISINGESTYSLQNLNDGYRRSSMGGESGILVECHHDDHSGSVPGDYFVGNLSGSIFKFVFDFHSSFSFNDT